MQTIKKTVLLNFKYTDSHWMHFTFFCSLSFFDLVLSSPIFLQNFLRKTQTYSWLWQLMRRRKMSLTTSTNIHTEPMISNNWLSKIKIQPAEQRFRHLFRAFSVASFFSLTFSWRNFFVKALDFLIIRFLFSLFKKTVMFKSAFLWGNVLWRMPLLLISVNRLELSVIFAFHSSSVTSQSMILATWTILIITLFLLSAPPHF